MQLSIAFKRLSLFAVAVLFVFLASHFAAAQTSGAGNINGTVTDSSGALVPNASVIVLNTDTGVSRTITTNSDGSYTATFLQPGPYEVTIGGGGYGKVDRKNLVLTVGQILTVDASLPPGSVSTEVIVTSESPLIDTDKSSVSQTIDQSFISNLPVATRNWSAFVLLTPNVTQDGGTGPVSLDRFVTIVDSETHSGVRWSSHICGHGGLSRPYLCSSEIGMDRCRSILRALWVSDYWHPGAV